MEEIWKSLKGIVEKGDNYEISNLGRLRNASSLRIIKHFVTDKGYCKVHLYLQGTPKPYFIHRLVALAFLPNPENLESVNHDNGNKEDNRLANLEWMTNEDNSRHAHATGLVQQTGSQNPCAVLTEEIVRDIKELYATRSYSQRALAFKFNVSFQTINNIVRGKSWTHVITDLEMPTDTIAIGFRKNAGSGNLQSKLTEDKVLEIRAMYGTGNYTSRELGKIFNVSKSVILNVVNYKTWKHVE